MPHSPKTSSLAAVTQALPGPDDAVDRLDAGLGQAVGQRADGLGAAGDDEHVHADEPGRAEQRLVQAALRVGRGGDDDLADAGDLRRNHAHQQRARIGGRTARAHTRRPRRAAPSAARSPRRGRSS